MAISWVRPNGEPKRVEGQRVQFDAERTHGPKDVSPIGAVLMELTAGEGAAPVALAIALL